MNYYFGNAECTDFQYTGSLEAVAPLSPQLIQTKKKKTKKEKGTFLMDNFRLLLDFFYLSLWQFEKRYWFVNKNTSLGYNFFYICIHFISKIDELFNCLRKRYFLNELSELSRAIMNGICSSNGRECLSSERSESASGRCFQVTEQAQCCTAALHPKEQTIRFRVHREILQARTYA